MLVLSRKQNEKIIIGDNISITVLNIRGNTVRIGIEAPRHISVVRAELPRKDKEATTKPVTVEFKSNGDGSQNVGPSLRVVNQEIDLDLTEEPEAGSDVKPEKVQHVNRLSQLVTQIASDGRSA